MGIAAGRILTFADLNFWEVRAFASGARFVYRNSSSMIFRHTCDEQTQVQCEAWFPDLAEMQAHRRWRERPKKR